MPRTTSMILAGLLVSGLHAMAQDAKVSTNPVYKVEFNLREGGGREGGGSATTGRRYTILVDANGRGSFRFGNKIPYATGSVPGVQKAGAMGVPVAATQIQYADVGVNIDCRVVEVGGKAAVHAEIEISHVVGDRVGANAVDPTIDASKVAVNATLELGKPSVIASVDDPLTQRKFDAEVTVTKVN